MALGGGSQAGSTPTVHGIRVSDSIYGVVMPLQYGRGRLPTHCLWLGDQTATLHSGGGKGLNSGSAGGSYYTYTASFLLAVCFGPSTSIGRLYNSNSSGLARWAPATVAKNFTIFLGAQGQAPWAHLTSAHPGQDLGYTLLTYLATLNWPLGETTFLPQLSFEVFGLFPFSATIQDANASAVVADMISNSIHGMVPGATWLDTGGTFVDYANYITAYNFFISPTFDQQQPGKQWLSLILELTHADCYWSEGQLRIVPYAVSPMTNNGVTWTPNITPTIFFDDNDYVVDNAEGHDPDHSLTVTINDPVDRHNVVKIEYIDVFTDYNIQYAEQIDDNDMILSGPRRGEPRQYHPIPNASMANEVAKLKLSQELFINRTYKFKVPPVRAALLDPMDVIGISSDYLGLSRYPVRIVSIDETGDEGNKTGDFLLEITAEDLSPDTTPGYLPAQMSGPQLPTDGFQTPNSINDPPLIFEPVTDNADLYQMWFAASGQQGNYQWGGANVWMSTDGGSTYSKIATITNPNAQGVLLSSLPSHADPDTVDTLAVDLTESVGELSSISTAEADLGNNLAWVDGELIAFANVATTATPFQYNLTYLRRGLYGTPITSHAAGSNFYFLNSIKLPDQSIAMYSYLPDLIGTPLFFKFTSFNLLQGGEEELSDVDAYTYTPVGPSTNNLNPLNALPWAAGVVTGVGSFVTFGGYGYVSLTSGTTGGSHPTFPKQFGATVNDNGIIWQNIGSALNIQKGSITGLSIGSLANPIVFGNAPAWASLTEYPLGSVVSDSNGNGEQAVAGLVTDSNVNVTPGSWAGHYPYLLNAATGAETGSLTGSSTHWCGESISVPPAASTPPDVFGVTNYGPAGTVSSVVLMVPTGVVAGDLLVAQITTQVAKTLTPPSGWTLLDQQNSAGSFCQMAIYTRVAGASEPSSYSWSWSGATNASGTMLRIVNAGTIVHFNGTTGLSLAPQAPGLSTSGAANALQMVLLGWGSTGVLTPPPPTSGASPPTWPLTEGTITQDGAIQWEQVGAFVNYGTWVTVASAELNVQSIHDAVKLTLTGDNAGSNIGINDKAWVQYLNGSTVVASGRADITANSNGAGTTVSGESSPVILRKTATGLSGPITIDAQIRVTNGSGNGIFAFALNTCELAMEDQIK